MKILILSGSGRRNGNTAQILDLIQTELAQEAAQRQTPLEVESLCLGDQPLQPCRGCRICFDRGEERCPIHDDLLALKAKMQAADGLILASPVYVDDVSGLTKTWIDRLAHVCHRPEFAGKYAYLLVTVGSTRTSHALRTMQIALGTWGFHIVGQSGLKMGALMKRADSAALFHAEARQIARRLVGAIQERRATRPTFFSLMVFRIQQLGWRRMAAESYDHQYWSNQGWLAEDRDYFVPHQAAPLKVFLARLAGSLLAPFVS